MRQEKIKAVVTFDPAIDTERMSVDQMLQYTKTRDFKLISPFLKPNEATIYNIREIPRSLFTQVLQYADEGPRVREAFRLGVESVDNLYQEDGVRLPSFKGQGKESTRDGNITVISEEELDRFAPAEVQEIGLVAFWHSFLPRRIAASYLLPRLSLDILTRQGFLSVDASQTGASPNSSKPLGPEVATEPTPEETGTSTVRPGAASDSATDASAEVSAS